MLGSQTVEFSDLGKVAVLLVLEALLSADNALILAIIVRHLPKEQQRKALFYGLGGAFILRIAAIALAFMILDFWWLQLIGALYLIYLPVKHFRTHASAKEITGKAGAGFWMTVIYADLADLAFAIDSVLVAVAVVNAKEKVWIVYAGAILGIILLRFAATWCLRLLDRYPILDHVAYALVGWAGIKLLLVGGHTMERWYVARHAGESFPVHIPEMHPAIFWGGLIVIVVVGGFLAFSRAAQEEADSSLEVGNSDTESVPEEDSSNKESTPTSP